MYRYKYRAVERKVKKSISGHVEHEKSYINKFSNIAYCTFI